MNLKDHFSALIRPFQTEGSGEGVAFASVSVDRETGRSKCCGIVEFTSERTVKRFCDGSGWEAPNVMRGEGTDGNIDFALKVRRDRQEKNRRDEKKQAQKQKQNRTGDATQTNTNTNTNSDPHMSDSGYDEEDEIDNNNSQSGFNDSLFSGDFASIPTHQSNTLQANPSMVSIGDGWRFGGDSDELDELAGDGDVAAIKTKIIERNGMRRQRDYEQADEMRETIKCLHNVYLDDMKKLWWFGDGVANANSSGDRVFGDKAADKVWRQVHRYEFEGAVDPMLRQSVEGVNQLLKKRDVFRRRKMFREADELLERVMGDSCMEEGWSVSVDDTMKTWKVCQGSGKLGVKQGGKGTIDPKIDPKPDPTKPKTTMTIAQLKTELEG